MPDPSQIAVYRGRCAPPLTQAGLADALGVHLNTIQGWERRGVPRAGQLLRLTRLLVERGAVGSYAEALAFWGAAARGGLAPPHELASQLTWPAPSPATAPLALPLGEAPQPSSLPPGSHLPFWPNPHFVGREGDLRVLAAVLRAPGAVAVVGGPGGIGKSQLAAEFAHRYGRQFVGGVRWLNAADQEGIAAQVVGSGGCDLAQGGRPLPFERRLALATAAWREPTPQLIILDDCPDYATLARWRPAAGGSRWLVTSRAADWVGRPDTAFVALSPLGRAASMALLQGRCPGLRRAPQALDELAHALGDIPLALWLASAYLYAETRPHEVSRYIGRLQGRHGLHHASLQPGAPSPTDYSKPVGEAIAASLDGLRSDDPVARRARAWLGALLWLAPGVPVPAALVAEALPDDARALDDAAARQLCEGTGLVERGRDGSFRLHALVRSALLTRLPEARLEPVAAALLRRAERASGDGLPLGAYELAHLRAAAVASQPGLAGPLWSALGWQLTLGGQYQAAIAAVEEAVRQCDAGGGQPAQTAAMLNRLALVLQSTDDYQRPEGLYRTALRLWERSGAAGGDAVTAVTNNLGYLYLMRGELERAEPPLREALRTRHLRHGLLHADTARSIHNMGYLRLKQGAARAARRYLRLALAVRRRVLPALSLATAFTLLLVAGAEAEGGNLALAEALANEALAMRRALVGERHDDVADAMLHQGDIILRGGDRARARAIYSAALALAREVESPALLLARLHERVVQLSA